MSKFINPFTDMGFKRLFGQEDSKIILIAFLNALFEGEFVIKDIDYRDKEQLPATQDKRGVIFDIFCTTDKGEHYILEMQNKSQAHFEDRAVYYAAQSIIKQGQKGRWGYGYNAVFGIYFLNFTHKVLADAFRSDFGIRRLGNDAPEKLQLLTSKLRMTFLQLPQFQKSEVECSTELDKWIYIMKNLEILNDIPWRKEKEAFEAMAQIANVSNMTEEEKNRYDDALREYQDAYATHMFAAEDGWNKGKAEGLKEGKAEGLKEGKAEGLKEGKAEGLKEGKVEGKAEVALSLIALNAADDFIAQVTGLSMEKIQELRVKGRYVACETPQSTEQS